MEKEYPEDKSTDGLTPAQQEQMAEAELHRVKKRQRLIESAKGRRRHFLALCSFLFLCLFAYAFSVFYYQSSPSVENVLGTGAFIVVLAVIFKLGFLEQRLNALMELMEEDIRHGLKSPSPRDED